MDRMNLWRGACAALALAAGFVAAPAGAQVQYIHTDALGSVVAVTDANRNVIERREFAPYGDQLNAPAADRGPGYTGHVEDGLTGLTYMQQRYYDPAIGRFLSVDPVGPLSNPINHFGRYHYAANNPYRYVDPDGRYFESAIEIASLGVGIYSFKQNIAAGNTGAAILDGVGIVLDGAALAVPIVPGGVGLGIKAGRGVDAAVSIERAADAGEATTTLYRAVGPDELSDIQNTGELINRGSAEGKYFTSSSADASSYAQQAVSAFGDAPYTTVKVDVPNSMLPSPVSVDGGIPAFVIPNANLPGLKPQVLDSMAIPERRR